MTQGKPIRVVLLHPPQFRTVRSSLPRLVSRSAGCLPPLGLLYLQAAIEQSRHESVFLDANALGWSYEQTVREVLSHQPDVVGLQAMSFNLPDAYLVARMLKSLCPEVKIVMGGPHPTLYPSETAALAEVDFAFAGEGEIQFVRFLDCFADADARAAVPGIASKHDGVVVCTPSAERLADLDSLACPARRSSPYKEYYSVLGTRPAITTMITSRGCPFGCIFCNRMGRTWRAHSADYVLREFDDIAQIGIGEVFIHDDTFTIDRGRVEDICRGLLQRRHGLIWQARTRVDCVNQRLLSLMRAAGCVRLSFGVESGSETVLKSMRKAIDLEQVKRVFAWCRREGITTLADFMIGNLDEEIGDIRKTLALSETLNATYVQYSICSPYPGTELYAKGLRMGLLARDVWLDFARDPLAPFESPVWSQHFTAEELARIASDAYRKFYMRPTYILKQAAKIRSRRQFMDMARAAIGMLLRRRRATEAGCNWRGDDLPEQTVL